MPKFYTSTTKYRVTCRCLACGKLYKSVIARIDSPDPPCPKKTCIAKRMAAEIKRQAENMAVILSNQKAPGTFSNSTRAIDTTNKIVSQDYGLTDLRNDDSVRQDESSAPKLPPHQQALADNFFGGGKIANPLMQQRMANAAAAAGSGALAPQKGEHIIDHVMQRRYKVPYKTIAQG